LFTSATQINGHISEYYYFRQCYNASCFTHLCEIYITVLI
jgi:hypothetical protein